MVHSLLAAWRVSLHRTIAEWPIVAAAALISLLAATLLAAGPIYSAAVSQAGLERVLTSAPTRDGNIEIQARVNAADVQSAGDQVRAILAETAGGAAGPVVDAGVSDSFALPGQDPANVRDLARLGWKEGLDGAATVVEGAWPKTAAAGQPIEVALLDVLATTANLRVGDQLHLVSRTNAAFAVDVIIVGTYRPNEPTAAFWWDDPALLEGVTQSTEFRTFGPLMTTREDLLGRLGGTEGGTDDILLTWHAFPAFDRLGIDEIGKLRARLDQLPARISTALPSGFSTVSTGLPALLETSERSLLASRTGVLLLLAQLAILAAYAIALTADLIVDQRRLDTAMLRSRGASAGQIARFALIEAALLAIPAALVAPYLASLVLRLFNVGGPLSGIGLEIVPTVSADAFIAAGAAAAGCALLLVLPAFNAAKSFAAERSGRSRQGTRTLGQRVGLDIALLAVTGVGLWQLRLYGTPLTTSVQGAVGIDPLLVAAPAVAIVAGSVVALRIVPLLATLADSLASRGRNLVGSLGARQLARRPLRYTRTALLLILAMSMGVFSLAYGATWAQSQRDQAAFQVGADLRVTPARGLDAMPGWAVNTAYRGIAGVTSTLPVLRSTMRLGADSGAGTLVALDADAAAAAGGLVAMRGADEQRSFANLASELAAARPQAAAIRLPDGVTRLAIAATIQLLQGPPIEAATAAATVTIRDARGLVHRFSSERGPATSAGWQFVVPIQATPEPRRATTERLGGGLTGPVDVIGIDLDLALPRNSEGTDGRITLDGVAASTSADPAPGDPATWQRIDLGAPAAWSLRASQQGGPVAVIGDGLTDALGVGVGDDGQIPAVTGVDQVGRGLHLSFALDSIAALGDQDLAAIVNQPFLAATAASVGSTIIAPLPGGDRRIHIVGVVDGFPTVDPVFPMAIVDLQTLAAARFAADGTATDVGEWWLGFDPALDQAARDASLAAARNDGPLTGARVLSQTERQLRLSTDPIALATIGALSLGFVVAGLFAVIGLAVSASVSARQRRTEFALLRAIGLSSGQLSGWLWLENASVVLVSVPAGTLLGLIISWVVLPFITVTQGGAVPFPPVLVDIPVAGVLALEAVSIVALAVTLTILGRWMRGLGVGSILRMGED